MRVEVHLRAAAVPRVYLDASTYEKGSFLCVRHGAQVDKYPIAGIFRVREDYPETSATNIGNCPAETVFVREVAG